MTQAVRNDGQPFGQVFLLGHDVVGDFQFDGGEMPDAPNAGLDHQVDGFLRHGSRHSHHPQLDFAATNKRAKLRQRLHLAAVDDLPNFFGIDIKRGDDAKSIIFKPAIAQQRGTEIAHADQNRLGLGVPTKKTLDGRDQLIHPEPDARRAGNPVMARSFRTMTGSK